MTQENLSRIYEKRFSGMEKYRNQVWDILISNFFSKWIKSNFNILDLGSGYGEFINNVNCQRKYAMDLNPRTRKLLDKNVIFHEQDCSKQWNIEPNSLDLVFTSNFFEHLPNKKALSRTMEQISKALKPGGKIIAIGPNISALNGSYWDFWDHHVALSHHSMGELFELYGFVLEKKIGRFLPYNMVRVRQRPLFLVRLYLKLPWLWLVFGKQFILIAQKGDS